MDMEELKNSSIKNFIEDQFSYNSFCFSNIENLKMKGINTNLSKIKAGGEIVLKPG